MELGEVEAASLAVSLRSAVCLLGGFPALAGVDLDVALGEVLLVAGPNGAGKSTLLRLLAGLLPLSGGAGSVLGHDLSTERWALRRSVGLLGHETPCYDDLSARENVRFWTGAGGRPLDAADAALYYAESLSVVQFVIDHFGEEKIAALIDAYREGVSHDDAALRALGVDLDELDRLWKESLGYQGDRGQAGGITPDAGNAGASLLASGALVMTVAAVAAIVAAVIVFRRSA
ncbi:MAG: ATP-binding cassette domain-containing protein, partial [Actinomycetota bacterium]